MAGQDEQTQTQSQKSETQPWAPAVPMLTGLLGKLQGINPGVTAEQQSASDALTAAAGGIPNLGGDALGAVNKLFGSSTSGSVGMLGDALAKYKQNIGATASGAELDPYMTPGFADAISKATGDITDRVKSTYAASGRDPSGAGSFAGSLGGALTESIAPTIAAQFNRNKENQMGAARSLWDAGSGAATTTAALDQIPLENAVKGIGMIPGVTSSFLTPAQARMGAADTAQNLPLANLLKLIAPGAALAGLGNTSSGTAEGKTVQPQSTMANILGGITGGMGLMSALGGSSATSLGLLGLLSDERTKDDIEEVGSLKDGQPVYRFRYKGDPVMRIGLMAQEVEKMRPDAVGEVDGTKFVDYGRATDRAAEMRKAA